MCTQIRTEASSATFLYITGLAVEQNAYPCCLAAAQRGVDDDALRWSLCMQGSLSESAFGQQVLVRPKASSYLYVCKGHPYQILWRVWCRVQGTLPELNFRISLIGLVNFLVVYHPSRQKKCNKCRNLSQPVTAIISIFNRNWVAPKLIQVRAHHQLWLLGKRMMHRKWSWSKQQLIR